MDTISLQTLFFSFCSIGLMMFGGGYAMLPILQREVVEKRGWISDEELLDCFAIAQCTPGVIAVNTATYIGYKKRGVTGGIVATLGVVAPSIIIILAIASLLRNFAEIEAVGHALAGIRVVTCVLVAGAVQKLFAACKKSFASVLIFIIAFGAVVFVGLSPVWPVLSAIAIGLLAGRLGRGGEEKK